MNPGVDVGVEHALAHDIHPFCLVDDPEIGGHPDGGAVLAEQVAAQAVEGGDPHGSRVAGGEHRAQPLRHVVGRLAGEGERRDAGGLATSGAHEVGDAGADHAGLSGPGAGEGAALLRWRPNQSLRRRRRGRRQLDPSRRGEERRRVRWPTVLLSSATDGGLPLVLARFVRGLSTHQGSGCLRQLRTAATAAKCHRAPVDSHRAADQMPTGPSMSRRRAPHAASPLPRG